ncbi:radical SAM protein [Acutalibacter muris]|uniref:radical SAM protein n=1 Tax=Acutalibacter muris TaxID=1796620 RepID=UPI001C3F0CE4|nr:radical SAM protein [Acutalibacter muris]
MKTLLRAREDHNLGQMIRLYQIDDKNIQYTFQQIDSKPKCKSHMEFPIFAHISLTDRCNLNCPYCYAKDGKHLVEMSTTDVMDLINICDQNGVFSITWTGGEPFMRDDLLDILAEANKRNIYQSILTNGTYIPEVFWKSKPEKNINLQFSLNNAWSDDPVDSENHQKVYRNIRKCLEVGLNPILTIVLEPLSEEQIDALMQELIENRVPAARLGFLLPVGQGNNSSYSQYANEIKKTIPIYEAIRDKYRNQIKLLYQFDKRHHTTGPFPRRFSMCEGATTLMYIDSDGSVYPCPLLKSDSDFYCGDVFRQDWAELWDAKPMWKLRSINECPDCDYNCKVWCPAIKHFCGDGIKSLSRYCLKTL